MSSNIYDKEQKKLIPFAGNSEATAGSLDGLSDVNISSPTDGQVLTYDAENQKWINADGAVVIEALGDISDVDLTNLQDGQSIIWDDTNQKWVNYTPTTYTAGHGIGIDNGVISDKTFVGTTAQWEALTSAQQAFYEERVLTDDEPDVQQKTNGHTIKDEDGVSKTQRSNLQFEGLDVTDDDVNDKTIVTPTTLKNEIYDVMGQNGAKNLLANTATSKTVGEVDFTVNADGSVTAVVNSAPSANRQLALDWTIGPGTYIVTGCPSGGSRSAQTYWLDVKYDGSTYINEIGEGIKFTVSSSISGAHVTIGVNCPIGTYTFYPMIRLASDTDDTYQPYAMTNKELTDSLGNYQLVRRGAEAITVASGTYGGCIDEICATFKTMLDNLSDRDVIIEPIYMIIYQLATINIRPQWYTKGDNFNIVGDCLALGSGKFTSFYLIGYSGSGSSGLAKIDMTNSENTITSLTAQSVTNQEVTLYYNVYKKVK